MYKTLDFERHQIHWGIHHKERKEKFQGNVFIFNKQDLKQI